MASGTDYAEQTLSVNGIDDQVISELMRRVCYNQSIYDDSLMEGSEYFGLSLSVSQATVYTQVRPMHD